MNFAIPKGLTTEQLNQEVQRQSAFIQDCLSSGEQDCWIPQLVVLTRRDADGPLFTTMISLAVPFNEDSEKRPLLRTLGESFCKDMVFPLAAILSAEAWAAPPARDSRGVSVEPRHNPTRKEVLMVLGAGLGGANSYVQAEIRRDANNHILPLQFPTVQPVKVRSALLDCFYHGFFHAFTKGQWA
jgi:hypothetical protein